MSTFTWIIDQSPNKKVKPRINEAMFGDGYSQRSGSGINRSLQTWSLAFTLRTKAEIDAIDNFLLDHDEGQSFDWTSPKGQAIKVICPEWDATYIHDGDASLSATFKQVPE